MLSTNELHDLLATLTYLLKHIEITTPQRLQPDARTPELLVLLYSMLSNQLDDFSAILAHFLECIEIIALQRQL
ncbi:hypothetical protein K503DRAFT_775230 [Rhizopogon vinicolor AM-OR11-026]|uniref:Uncharacterized protein n=1 Tax=Rhizopogon vinicolor AM-OR11-026 TaxID=1314800 RepID=A0A1B7MMF2_9AGAM|nr:hypothetical protein K503DRAFT_775230 [Rhizopogon vinicolor AM-OR11-026]